MAAAAAVDGPLVPEEPRLPREPLDMREPAPSRSREPCVVCAVLARRGMRVADRRRRVPDPQRDAAAERADPLAGAGQLRDAASCCCAPSTDPSAPVAERHLLRRRPPGLHRHPAVRSSASGTPGRKSTAHQIRAVFNLPDGGRVARTVRTKGLGFADKVNVEVVQVTVTVTDDSGHFVARHSALGVPRLRGRQAADDHLLRVRGRAARADRRRRHQRQHDAGDAEAEDRP